MWFLSNISLRWAVALIVPVLFVLLAGTWLTAKRLADDLLKKDATATASPLGRPMKRALSIASVALVAAFVAGAMFLLPATLPPEVIEWSVVREPTVLEKAWHLPVASAFDRHVDFQSNQSLCGPASIANILRSFGEAADTEKRFSLIRQSAGRASASLDYPSTNSPT